MGYIYLITNTQNNQKYVGQTIHENIETRWNQHRKMRKTMLGPYLYNAYAKYGIHNFEFKIICICFDEACDELEQYYIKKFNTLVPNGYNLREGGNNSRHNEESKKLMSKNRKGKGTGPLSDEVRKSRIGRFAGEKNPNYKKPLTDDQRRQRSEQMKKIWEQKKKFGYTSSPKLLEALASGRQKRLDDAKKRRDLQKEISKGRKQRVAKLDSDGNILEEFESITDAAKKTGVQSTKISLVCRHGRKTTGGFGWMYLDCVENKRNNSTGELYITKQGSGYMFRINKKSFKARQWFKTLEDAILYRIETLKNLN